jgi:hypothetical protein
MQLRAGRGYERASSLKARGEKPWALERAMRDSRINMIVEGTSDILRLFIAREALDKHLRIAGNVLNPRLSIFTRLATAVKAAAFYGWWYPWQWVGPLVSIAPRFAHLGRLAKHMRYASRASHRLARSVFHLMLRNGPALEKRQLQLMRVVDIATDLFAIAATIGRARSGTVEGSREQAAEVADLFCTMARQRIEMNFRSLRSNPDRLYRRVGNQVLEGQNKWLEREAVFT